MRRLQREAFQDLLQLKTRVSKLEYATGLLSPSPSSSLSSPHSASRPHGSVLSRTRLTGEVATGAAVVPAAQSQTTDARAALEQAGMRSGLTTRFRFETACRAADLLLTELTAGLGEESSSFMLGGPMNLSKVLYLWNVREGVQVTAAPLGAVGSDMAEPVNPLKVRGQVGATWGLEV